MNWLTKLPRSKETLLNAIAGTPPKSSVLPLVSASRKSQWKAKSASIEGMLLSPSKLTFRCSGMSVLELQFRPEQVEWIEAAGRELGERQT